MTKRQDPSNTASRQRLTALSVALLSLLSVLHPARAQAASASATALITVRVLGHADTAVAEGAVTVSKVSDLDFGRVPVSPRGSSAVVAPASRSAATYRIGGGYNAIFALALPDIALVSNGSSSIAVTSFTTAGAPAGQLSEKGTATVGVGASIEVPPGQVPGLYSGSFPLTVAYN